MYANSTPVAPPPTMTTRFGVSRSSSASLLVMTVSRSTGRLGMVLSRAPVAMMTLFAERVPPPSIWSVDESLKTPVPRCARPDFCEGELRCRS